MARPQHHDKEGGQILDGRGRFTQKDLAGSRQYADHVKILETDENGFAITKLPIGKHRLWDGVAVVSLMKGDGTQFATKHIEENAETRRPEYDLAEVRGVNVHLRDGLKPDADGVMFARVEINVRIIQPKDQRDLPVGEKRHFLSINLFPTTDEPSACLIIRRNRGGSNDHLNCLKHWGPDYNRSHVFVCPLSENIADHAKVAAEERWLDLVKEWEETVKTLFEGSEFMGETLDVLPETIGTNLEKEICEIRNTLKEVFLETLRISSPLTDEQRLSAAKRWIDAIETLANSEQSNWMGCLNQLQDKDLEYMLNNELHMGIASLDQLFRKLGIDQATYDEAIKAVIP
ncbi:MAG: hypothetical protein PHC70_00425 [Patescibacteria group bacterium]|nr:hypothetical protein [Patescibacteria group bacterium]